MLANLNINSAFQKEDKEILITLRKLYTVFARVQQTTCTYILASCDVRRRVARRYVPKVSQWRNCMHDYLEKTNRNKHRAER